jgi:molecular chaperone DnaK (HSP70)
VRIGIDFGTTRIVVAAADRGNYPLVNFEASGGRIRDWFPSVLAISGEQRVYGWEALDLEGQPGWTILRSLKRWLKDAGPQSEIEFAGQRLCVSTLATEMMAALRRKLMESSSLAADKPDRLQTMLGVPANANCNQRFLTEEVARAAGFEVLGLSNEPSAAAIEFAFRDTDRKGGKSGLLVYDLGGGTFDASLVAFDKTEYSVVASDGVPNLGGDDFDEILAALALEAAGTSREEEGSLTAAERFHLLDECCNKKEALNPNSRKVTVDLQRVRPGWSEVSIPVDIFYERCRPLIERSRAVLEDMLARHSDFDFETLYLTGGGSELPPVARILRETFGRRVRRSSYMRSATAIGLAIRAAGHEGCVLRDQFTQNFGVWREADGGHNVVFDVIFPRGIKLPRRSEQPLRIYRTYRPVHDIGHFRYLECAHLDACNQPMGELSNWDEIRVPFDPGLRDAASLDGRPVQRFVPPQDLVIEEEYSCDSDGKLKVRICDKFSENVTEYRLGRWSLAGRHRRARR